MKYPHPRAHTRRLRLAHQKSKCGKAHAGQDERNHEGGRIAIAEEIATDQIFAREIGQHRRDQPAGHIAQALQPSAPRNRYHLRQQELERHALRPGKKAQHEKKEHHCRQKGGAIQKPPGQRNRQNRYPHHGTEPHRKRQDVLAVLDQRRTHDGRHHTAELLQPQPQPDDHIGTGQHMQIGRNEGRRIEQAKPRHPQHAVQEMAGIIALQVLPDEFLIGRLALVLGLQALINVYQSVPPSKSRPRRRPHA